MALIVVGCGNVAPHQEAAGASARLTARVGPSDVSVGLQSGWNGLAFQCQQVTSLNATAGVVGFARWTGSAYVTGNLTASEINAAGTRQGFWVLANSPANLTYAGTDDGTGTVVDLKAGYQLVSFCSSSPTPGSALTASRDGQPVPLASAVLPQFQEVGPGPAYTTVDVTAGGVLQPGRPYWVFANGPVRLTLPAPPAPSPSPLPAIVSLSLQPTDVSLALPGTVQFTLTARLADGTSRDVTSLASWSSADPSVAALLSPGLFKALNPFPTRVTATVGGQIAATGLVVSVQPTIPPAPSPSPEPRIYVADQGRNRIVRMDDMAGAHNVSQTLIDSGTRFNQPTGVCLDADGRIYVADYLRNRLVRMDDMTGANNVSQTLAGSGSAFRNPSAVFVDRANRIYVADEFGVGRIVRMDDMTGANNVTQTLAASGTAFGPVSGVWVDVSGRIYVTDRGNNRVVRMQDMSGANNVSYGLPGAVGLPWGVFVDASDRIYVPGEFAVLRMDNMTGAKSVIQNLSGSGSGFSTPRSVFAR